ncbi:MAG: DUF4142 domain-containing protein [Bdellovibrionota bacterium]
MIKNIATFLVLAFAANVYAQAPAATLNDAQVAMVLVEINEGEVDAGQIAKDKVQLPEVKKFAKDMIDEHKANKKTLKELADKGDFDPKKSDLAKSIKEEAKASNKELKKSGKDVFDKAFLAQQITMHEKALTLIKDTLLPNTKNPALREHLEKTQASVQMHLEHAKELSAKL